MEEIPAQRDVDEFILRRIDSVPHLEALLLLWTSQPRVWSVDDMAKALYVRTDMAQAILEDLAQRELISVVPNQPQRYVYAVHSDGQNELMQAVDRSYRHELVRISTMIHSKASSLRDFARAFRFTKEKEIDFTKEKDTDKENH
jgi:predicted ArsR family transcriptional regulator